jgi:hypothetical protein
MWRSWIEPLPGPLVDSPPPRLFEAQDSDPDSARLATFELMRSHFDGLDSLTQNEFHLRYSVPMKFRDIPPVEWPPQHDSYRKLDAIEAARKSRAVWPVSN